MKYATAALLVALAAALALTLIPKLANREDPKPQEEMTLEERARSVGMTIKGSLDPEYGEKYAFVMTEESGLMMKEGEMYFTVTGARVVSNINDLPEGTLFDPTASVCVEGGETAYYIHPYPPEDGGDRYDGDFASEDGSFIPGVYMVTVDVRLENRDAVNYVLWEDEHNAGFYWEPDMFWATELISLRDMGNEAYAGNFQHYADITESACFYSDFGAYPPPDREPDEEQKASSMYLMYEPEFFYSRGVRVAPGEEKDITLGYIITPVNGHMPRPEDLCAISAEDGSGGDSSSRNAVYLGLKSEGGVK